VQIDGMLGMQLGYNDLNQLILRGQHYCIVVNFSLR
jgi:hypothetical protein